MIAYSIALEVFLYLSAAYLFFKKKELIIIYLPMLFFTRGLVSEPVIRAFLWYVLVTGLLIYAAQKVSLFKRINFPAICLFFYFTLLFVISHDMSDTRSSYLQMFALVSVFCIAPNLYEKHGKDVIVRSLYGMSCVTIVLFVGNCILSSATGYAPRPFYGQTTGILYGNMSPTSFMVVPIALFIFLAYNFRKISLINITLGLTAFAFVAVSMRRTSALAAFLAVGAFLAMLFMEKDKKKFLQLSALVVVVTAVGVFFTDLTDQFSDRYYSRFEDRAVVQEGEGRFTDHTLVYEDIFVHNRYSALFGYGFFNSAGNYGGGVHGSRSLHPDIPVIVHASGVVGLLLYLGMVGTGFMQSSRACRSAHDRILWLFCLAVFVVFTISGRITETAYAMAIFLLLLLPVASAREMPEEEEEEETENVKTRVSSLSASEV